MGNIMAFMDFVKKRYVFKHFFALKDAFMKCIYFNNFFAPLIFYLMI